jgi:hypothetical protein
MSTASWRIAADGNAARAGFHQLGIGIQRRHSAATAASRSAAISFSMMRRRRTTHHSQRVF